MKIFRKGNYPNSEFMSENGFYIPSGLNLNIKERNISQKQLIKFLNSLLPILNRYKFIYQF